MGLFDSMFDPQDPTSAAKLSAAFGLLGGQNAGQAGLAGIQAAQRFKMAQDEKKRAEMQDQMMRMQMEGMQRTQAGEQAAQSYVTGALAEPDASMTPDMPGPRREPAGFNLGAALAAGVPMNTALSMAGAFQKQQPKFETIAPGAKGGYYQNGKWVDLVSNPKAEDLPNAVQEYKFAQSQGYRGTFEQWDTARKRAGASQVNLGQPIAGVDASGNPVFFQQPKSGGAPVIVPGVRPSIKADKDLTDAQAKANLFGTRAQEADKILTDLAAKGTASPSMAQQMTNPSGITGRIATAIATPQQQQADQAQRDFINAVLRRESGAVIADTEFANARLQYFPQPGDSPQVVAQKARNRKIATEGILAEVPQSRRGVPAANTPADTGFSDADKERRYQEWKAKQK